MKPKHLRVRLRDICAGLTTVVLCSTGALAQTNGGAPDAGVWFGGFASNAGAQFSVKITAFDTVGEVILDGKNWQGFGNGQCVYAFRKTDGVMGELVFNQASSTNPNCQNAFAFTSERLGPDHMEITLAPDLSGAIGIDAITLNANLRPLRAQDRAVQPEGLDILGLRPGMTQPDVEAELSAMGFALDGDPQVLSGQGYDLVQQHWSRTMSHTGGMSDHVSVAYSATYEGSDEPSRLMAIARRDAPQTPMSMDTFEKALNDKYGPAISSQHRVYLRDGANTGRGVECPTGPLQAIEFTQVIFDKAGVSNHNRQIGLYCGPSLSIRVSGDGATGSVRNYEMSLVDPDEVWADFWLRWSRVNEAPIIAFLEASQSKDQSAPDL